MHFECITSYVNMSQVPNNLKIKTFHLPIFGQMTRKSNTIWVFVWVSAMQNTQTIQVENNHVLNKNPRITICGLNRTLLIFS